MEGKKWRWLDFFFRDRGETERKTEKSRSRDGLLGVQKQINKVVLIVD